MAFIVSGFRPWEDLENITEYHELPDLDLALLFAGTMLASNNFMHVKLRDSESGKTFQGNSLIEIIEKNYPDKPKLTWW